MARVNVYYRASLAERIGKTEEPLEAKTVHDVLTYIKKTYGGEAYKQASRMLIAVDNDSILLHKGFGTRLAEGAQVRFMPICGGG